MTHDPRPLTRNGERLLPAGVRLPALLTKAVVLATLAASSVLGGVKAHAAEVPKGTFYIASAELGGVAEILSDGEGGLSIVNPGSGAAQLISDDTGPADAKAILRALTQDILRMRAENPAQTGGVIIPFNELDENELIMFKAAIRFLHSAGIPFEVSGDGLLYESMRRDWARYEAALDPTAKNIVLTTPRRLSHETLERNQGIHVIREREGADVSGMIELRNIGGEILIAALKSLTPEPPAGVIQQVRSNTGPDFSEPVFRKVWVKTREGDTSRDTVQAAIGFSLRLRIDWARAIDKARELARVILSAV